MPTSVPLKSTVRIDLDSGNAAGQRRYRLSHALEMPPKIRFGGELPIEGTGRGTVTFALPEGEMLAARAKLFFDPEHPEHGSQAELVELEVEQLRQIEGYVERRSES